MRPARDGRGCASRSSATSSRTRCARRTPHRRRFRDHQLGRPARPTSTCPVGATSRATSARQPYPSRTAAFPITRGQVLAVLPFGNVVGDADDQRRRAEDDARERRVVAAGTATAARPVSAQGRFPQVSGLCFTVRHRQPPPGAASQARSGRQRDGSCTGDADQPDGGGDLQLAKNDFTAGGGDGYPNFRSRMTTQDILDQDLADYSPPRRVASISPVIQHRIHCTDSDPVTAPACPVGVAVVRTRCPRTSGRARRPARSAVHGRARRRAGRCRLLSSLAAPAALAHDGSAEADPRARPGQLRPASSSFAARTSAPTTSPRSRSSATSAADRARDVTSDGEGHFTVAVQISADAPAGRLHDRGGRMSGPHFVTPIVDRRHPGHRRRGDGAPAGQDEGLPAIAPTPVAASAASSDRGGPPGAGRRRPPHRPSIDLVPFVALAGAVGALGLLVWRTRRPPAASAVRGLVLASCGDPRTPPPSSKLPDKPGVYLHEGRPRRRRLRRQGAEPAQPGPLVLAEAGAGALRESTASASVIDRVADVEVDPDRLGRRRRCCSRPTSSSGTGRGSTSGSRTTRATRTSRSRSATSSRGSSGRASSSTTAAATSGRTRRRRASTNR